MFVPGSLADQIYRRTDRLRRVAAFVIVRRRVVGLGGGHAIATVEPAAKIDEAAARRTERPEPRHGLLAANGAWLAACLRQVVHAG